MATRIWQSINGTWDAANFGGTLPVDDDIVIIPNWARIAPAVSLTQTGVLLTELLIERGCTIDIGAPGNPAVIGAKKLRDFGNGNTYHTNDAGLTTQTYIDKPTGTYFGDGNASLLCAVRRGGARLNRSHIWVESFAVPGTPTQIRIEPGITNENLIVDGGTIENYGAATDIIMRRGLLEQMKGAITRLNMFGGICYFDSSDTLASARIQGGLFDATRATVARTITAIQAASRANLIYDGSTTFGATPIFWDEEAMEVA